jgi:hypothetical protein
VSAPKERVLRELPASEPLYAVLDGARDRHVRTWVLDTRAPAWCLFRGELPASLEDAAPWLLKLLPGHPTTDQFFARAWGRAWGILLTCSASSRELRRHLRRFFMVRTEEGRRLLFRYYDPRVLRLYLPSCTPEEVAHFLGPITAMAAEADPPDAFHVFRRPEGAGGAPDRRALASLIIRDAQLRAFEAALEQDFRRRAATHLRQQFPEHCRDLGEDRVAKSVAIAMEKRREYGLETEESVLLYLDTMYLLSFDFDDSSAWPWAKETLRDADLSARTRVLLVNERAWKEAGAR